MPAAVAAGRLRDPDVENLFLIVGLGNPGSRYAHTHHNAGYLAVERLARHWQVDWRASDTFESRLARADREGRKAILCQPVTYMNLSGVAVRKLMDYYRVPSGRLLVIVDDADLPLGELRLRPSGSSGGHHGLESVEQHLGRRDYARLRLGIGRDQPASRQITDFVLSRIKAEEMSVFDTVLETAVRQVECWLVAGVQKAMNDFNGRVNQLGKKES